ncbi:MAG: glycosyl hydrolase family 65 protein [Halioglobus sp.]
MTNWTLVYNDFVPSQEGLREVLCALGNGYFCSRGAAPEAKADNVHYPGTYVAGGYNRLITKLGDHEVANEDLVNLPNWLCLTFRPEGGDWFNPQAGGLLAYHQELDLKRGVLTRRVRFRDKADRETTLTSRHLVHMGNHHLAALEMSLTAENWSGPVLVQSALDGNVINAGVERYRELSSSHLEPMETGEVGADWIYLRVQTNLSHIQVAQAARTQIFRNGEPLIVARNKIEEEGYVADELSFDLVRGETVRIEKIVSLYTSRDHGISECGLAAREAILRVECFDAIFNTHVQAWARLWRRCDIVLEPAGREQLILRLHIFHLLQTTSPNILDLDVGVPARGLHGEAYRGHIFWDELFILPFLTLRLPDVTRTLLLYRFRRLNEARWNAVQAGCRGAMFPWQSGSDGQEESQLVHLNPRSGHWIEDNSSLQKHVNAAIVYNVWQYVQVTMDMDFLSLYGAEMILEIARFWASAASYNPKLERYEILRVMGPDEYHDRYPDAEEAGLNNNAYTNLMAVWVLCRALDVLDILDEERRQSLCERLDLGAEEIDHWEDVSRKMRLVIDDDGIISQFEGYEDLDEFDWEGYRQKYGDIHRLDRILEAEGDTPNCYKVSKQADVLMLMYLFSSEELSSLFERLGYSFEHETISKNVDYYMKRTTQGSTLSRIVHSWVLARSDRARSWKLFCEALESDIADIQGGTTSEGIHLGAMAGTVDIIQRAYTGLEMRETTLHFNPCLPDELKSVRQKIGYRGHWLDIEVTQDHLTISAAKSWASPVEIGVRDEVHILAQSESITVQLR